MIHAHEGPNNLAKSREEIGCEMEICQMIPGRCIFPIVPGFFHLVNTQHPFHDRVRRNHNT